MYRKMVSDGLILVGIILAYIGWTGSTAGGTGGFVGYVLFGLGILLCFWGLARYIKGHKTTDD